MVISLVHEKAKRKKEDRRFQWTGGLANSSHEICFELHFGSSSVYWWCAGVRADPENRSYFMAGILLVGLTHLTEITGTLSTEVLTLFEHRFDGGAAFLTFQF